MIPDVCKGINCYFNCFGRGNGRALFYRKKNAEKAGGAGSPDRGCQTDCHHADNRQEKIKTKRKKSR